MSSYDIFVLGARPSDAALVTTYLKSKEIQFEMYQDGEKKKPQEAIKDSRGLIDYSSQDSKDILDPNQLQLFRAGYPPIDIGGRKEVKKETPPLPKLKDCYCHPCQSPICQDIDLCER